MKKRMIEIGKGENVTLYNKGGYRCFLLTDDYSVITYTIIKELRYIFYVTKWNNLTVCSTTTVKKTHVRKGYVVKKIHFCSSRLYWANQEQGSRNSFSNNKAIKLIPKGVALIRDMNFAK